MSQNNKNVVLNQSIHIKVSIYHRGAKEQLTTRACCIVQME